MKFDDEWLYPVDEISSGSGQEVFLVGLSSAGYTGNWLIVPR